ncbi:MAG: Ig-like domain-containing protein [Polyangiaceae bacterium]|nr:Ig-like domain-containing protein [Polyangiaceae bacterium]
MRVRASSVLSLVSVGLLVAACGGSDGGSSVGGEGATAGVGGSAAGSGGDAGSGGSSGSGNAGSGGQAGSAGAGGDAGSAGSAVGGSAGNGGSAGAASGGTGGVEEDTTPPRIVEALPADGAVGVRDDAKIVITFSEPMDQAATEAAYESPDIPAGQATMEWNAAGDVLTITPNAPLKYRNVGIKDLPGFEFAYKINTTATDLAGNALETDPEYHFTGARLRTAALKPVPALTGFVEGANFVAGGSAILVGDANDNREYRGFLTVDMSTLPDGVLEFEEAKLRVEQVQVIGTPYVGHGNLTLQEVDFAALDKTSFSAPALQSLGQFTHFDTLVEKSKDVTSVLEADYTNRAALGDLCQFRLQFDIASDFDSSSDRANFSPSTLGIDVTYLAE